MPAPTIRRDGVRLAARLLLPGGTPPFPCVAFVHGRGSSKESPRNVTIAYHLLDAGIGALLFDLNGHGESSHDPLGGDESYVRDLVAVFAWMRQHPRLDRQRLGIAGSSLGAVIALEAARSGLVSPSAMVLRAPPAEAGAFAGLAVPSLVLVGSRDPLLADVERAVQGNFAVELCVVEGAGHLFEEPEGLREALDRTVSWFRARIGAEALAGRA